MNRKRHTRQEEIISFELSKINSFFSAKDLFKKAIRFDSSLGIATVYRFLADLVKNHELFSYKCDRRTIYSKREKSHCHFICEKTGRVTHFSIDSLDFLKDKIPGSINSFQIEVKGLCDKHASFLSKNKGKKKVC